jgi:acyl dehydratase
MMDLTFDDAAVGTELPPFALALTLQRLVMEAAANRDYAPIHHDRDITKATGVDEPYANTMLVQAIFEAMLRQWMGGRGRLCTLGFSMRSFAMAGAMLSAHGTVVSVHPDPDGGGQVELEIWTESRASRAAVGTATVWLPPR